MSDTPFNLEHKTIVVIGASRGIGKALAEGFLAAGAMVYGSGTRVSSFSDGSSKLPESHRLVVNVRDAASVADALENVISQRDSIDCLINNAGITQRVPASQLDSARLDEIYEVNTKGLMTCCRTYHKLQRNKGGCIINVSSIAATHPIKASAAYSASKAAVSNLTRCLAVEWARHGIRVNSIAPGFIDTDLADKFAGQDERRARLEEKIPLGRLGRPQDVVGAALFLASPAAAYVTGHELVVDGGVTSYLDV